MCKLSKSQISTNIHKWSTIPCVKKKPNSTALSILSMMVTFSLDLSNPPLLDFLPAILCWQPSETRATKGRTVDLEDDTGLKLFWVDMWFYKETDWACYICHVCFSCQEVHWRVKQESKCITVSTEHSRVAASRQVRLWIFNTIFVYIYLL